MVIDGYLVIKFWSISVESSPIFPYETSTNLQLQLVCNLIIKKQPMQILPFYSVCVKILHIQLMQEEWY